MLKSLGQRKEINTWLAKQDIIKGRNHKFMLYTQYSEPLERNQRRLILLNRELTRQHTDLHHGGGDIWNRMFSKKYEYEKPKEYYAEIRVYNFHSKRHQRKAEKRHIHKRKRQENKLIKY